MEDWFFVNVIRPSSGKLCMMALAVRLRLHWKNTGDVRNAPPRGTSNSWSLV